MQVDTNRIVLGTAQFGLDYGITNRSGKVGRKEAFSILSLAWDNGVRCFDTAPVYGSEELLGEFFATHGIEEEVIVFTKIPKLDNNQWYADAIETSIHRSTERLGCPIDTLFFHDPGDSILLLKDPFFFRAILAGKHTENFGVSVYDPVEITRLQESPFDLVYQYPFNVADHRFKRLEYPEERKCIRSIFLQGLLVSETSLRDESPWYLVDFHKKYRAMLEHQGIKPLNFALSFVVRNKPNSRLIIGAESASQLQEIFDVEIDEKTQPATEERLATLFFDPRVRDPRKWSMKT